MPVLYPGSIYHKPENVLGSFDHAHSIKWELTATARATKKTAARIVIVCVQNIHARTLERQTS